MMPLASFPSTVSWLGANDDGLLVCALADGTLGLAQPINFSLYNLRHSCFALSHFDFPLRKHDDAPKFNETMTLDSPAIETRTRVLDAASSLLAVLSADKLRVFAAKKGDKTVLNDANLKIFEFENACSCDFSCDALNNLVRRAAVVSAYDLCRRALTNCLGGAHSERAIRCRPCFSNKEEVG